MNLSREMKYIQNVSSALEPSIRAQRLITTPWGTAHSAGRDRVQRFQVALPFLLSYCIFSPSFSRCCCVGLARAPRDCGVEQKACGLRLGFGREEGGDVSTWTRALQPVPSERHARWAVRMCSANPRAAAGLPSHQVLLLLLYA